MNLTSPKPKNDRKGYNKAFFTIVLSDAGFKAEDNDHGPLWPRPDPDHTQQGQRRITRFFQVYGSYLAALPDYD
jgi:hypothetical protein